MFKNWFSSSTGERLRARSRPANTPKPHSSSHSRGSSAPTPHKTSHSQRRSSTTAVTNVITHSTTKKPHASIVVRKDGNIEVVTPRATVVLPEKHSNVSRANVVPPQTQAQHRSIAKATSPATPVSSGHRQGNRESTQNPKPPHSSRSERLPTHVANTGSRHRSASYSGYSRDYDYAIPSSREPPPIVQVVKTSKFPRRGSYPLAHLPANYAHEPSPVYPEVIYPPLYPQPPPLQHALYPTPAPRPRRSLSNAESISSYSDYSPNSSHTHAVPRGWYNRRGDQYMRRGVVIMQPPARQWHPVFASYPDVGKGYMDEDGNFLAQSGGILKGGNGLSLPSDIHIK